MMEYESDNIVEAEVVITVISCCLSLIGAFFIVVSYFALPEIRNYTRKLLLCLTIADSLTASGYLLAILSSASSNGNQTAQSNAKHVACVIQSFITTYSSLVSFFLTVIIEVHIFVTVVTKRNITGSKRWFVTFNGVSFAIPGIILLLAAVSDVLGENRNSTGPWCWIRTDIDNDDRMFWMLITGKGWEVTCYLSTTMLYLMLKYVIALSILQSFGDPAQAFFNFIFFCFLDKTVRSKLTGKILFCNDNCWRCCDLRLCGCHIACYTVCCTGRNLREERQRLVTGDADTETSLYE